MKKIVVVSSNENVKKALEAVGKELGYEIKVEVQTDENIKYEISEKEIKEATAVLFAVEISIEEIEKIERFIDCEYYEVEPKFILNDAKAVINEIIMDLN